VHRYAEPVQERQLSPPASRGGRPRAQRVVVLGGGFAGVSTAQELARQLRRQERLVRRGKPVRDADRAVEVVLLNRDNYFVFQPLLADIISGTIETTHVVVPLRRMLRDVEVDVGYIERVDVATRHVELRRRMSGQIVRVPYDAVIVALGSITDFTGVPGMAEHALGVRTLGDAFYLRNRALDMLEEASVEPDPDRRSRLLTFVVVGGGSTGVEVAAELHDLLEVARRSFPEDPQTRVLLVHGGPYLVPSLGERLGRYTTKKLREAGVELVLGRRLTKVNPESVELNDGTTIEAVTVVSTVGNAPHPVVSALPGPKDARGWITPDATFRVPGLDRVWALGDCASIVDPKTGRPMPATAQHAVREGPHAARNVLAVLDGREPEPFHYGQLGMLVSLGRFKGVGEIFGIKVSGFVAWFLWRSYYLLRLPTLDRKIRVALDWTLDFLLKRDIVEISVRRTRTRPGESPGQGIPGEPVSVGAREAPEELVL
jgi:NADH dehydrogenase